MASDDAYTAFLNKANAAPLTDKATSSGSASGILKAVNTDVPKPLEEFQGYYSTESDEPFEPVSLKWEGDAAPSAGESRRAQVSCDSSDSFDSATDEFSALIGVSSDKVESISRGEFDALDQYKKVIDAVKKEVESQLAFFRVKVDSVGTKKEYFVIGADMSGGRVVGLKALAVQT
jgi:hypothetical protein